MTSTARRWLIEAKVAASTASAAGVGIGVAVLNDVENDSTLLGGTPAWAQALILVVIPPVVAFMAGWKAKHTSRPDLGEQGPIAAPSAGPGVVAAAVPPVDGAA
jgi:hypothetical protein